MSASRTALAVVGLLLLLRPASAGRGAALLPALKPAGAPELRDRFHEAVTRGLQQGGVDAISSGEIRMRLGVSDELMTCAGPGPCAARIGSLLRVELLVSSEIQINGKDYVIKLRALDAVGRELAKVDESCDICTIKEADDAVARAAARLAVAPRAGATTPPVTPPPVDHPPVTPPPVTPPPTVTPPVTPPPMTTPPITSPAPDRPAGPTFYFWGAIGGVALGVLGIAIGAPLVAIDGGYTGCQGKLPDPAKDCASIYQTKAGGAVMLTVGVLGFAGAGTLFYLDYRARHKPTAPRVSLMPIADGGMLTLSGRF